MKVLDNRLSIGEIVYSKVGRDKGKYYVIMWTEDEFVGICDGNLHKIDKIKKKKYKHLFSSSKSSDFLKNKIVSKEKITNSDVRKSILEFQSLYDKIDGKIPE